MLATARMLFARLSPGGRQNFADTLRTEKTAVGLLLAATVAALVWANSPWRGHYEAIASTVAGPASLGLDLTVAHWATDGLLAIFFFVVGLELKREVVTGELRRPSTAIVPIIAAVGGMIAPALIYTAVNAAAADGSPQGWAVPVATDIAFAVAVLAAFGRHIPIALRAFLLTLAVVDDLLGIIIIAIFYSEGVDFLWLAATIAGVGVFAHAVRSRRVPPVLLVALAVMTWAFMHTSGVHSTIAGVLLGFTVPALARTGEADSLAARFEHRWRPLSAGLAVPVFAFFAAGVSLDLEALSRAISDPAAQGVALGLVLGKPIGILAATALLARFTRASLAPGLSWWDICAVSVVAGMGFTVSLLIGELSFATDGSHEAVKAAVLFASLTAAVVGGAMLALRSRLHARHQTLPASDPEFEKPEDEDVPALAGA